MSMEEQRAKILGANGKGEEAIQVIDRATDLTTEYGKALAVELAGSTQPEAAEALALVRQAEEAVMSSRFYLVEASDRVATLAAKL